MTQPPYLPPSQPQDNPPSGQPPELPRKRLPQSQTDESSGGLQIQRPSSAPGIQTSSSPWRTNPSLPTKLEGAPSSPLRREVLIALNSMIGDPEALPGSPGPQSSPECLEVSL